MSRTDRIALQGIRLAPGYEALKRLMDEACSRAERDCLSMDPVTCDKASILAAHSRARAYREFLTAVTSGVDHELAELKAELEEGIVSD